VMDFPVVSPEYPGGIQQESIPGILGSSEALSGELVLAEEIFDLETVEVQLITDTQYLLTVSLKTEAAGLLQGDYTFVKSGLNWKIQSLGALTAVEEVMSVDDSTEEAPVSSMDSTDASEAEDVADEVIEDLEETAEDMLDSAETTE
jgi:hypothetical protein